MAAAIPVHSVMLSRRGADSSSRRGILLVAVAIPRPQIGTPFDFFRLHRLHDLRRRCLASLLLWRRCGIHGGLHGAARRQASAAGMTERLNH